VLALDGRAAPAIADQSTSGYSSGSSTSRKNGSSFTKEVNSAEDHGRADEFIRGTEDYGLWFPTQSAYSKRPNAVKSK
jgi:hypothetical protein